MNAERCRRVSVGDSEQLGLVACKQAASRQGESHACHYLSREPVTTMPVRGAVLRGPVKVRLIQDLALDACSERALAEEYGVSQPSIHEFKGKYGHEILTARGDLENHFAGLWIASKLNRLAELEDDVEQINALLTDAKPDQLGRLWLAKHRALRNAAEELGQLAPRKVDATVSVRYEVVGVDMAALE